MLGLSSCSWNELFSCSDLRPTFFGLTSQMENLKGRWLFFGHSWWCVPETVIYPIWHHTGLTVEKTVWNDTFRAFDDWAFWFRVKHTLTWYFHCVWSLEYFRSCWCSGNFPRKHLWSSQGMVWKRENIEWAAGLWVKMKISLNDLFHFQPLSSFEQEGVTPWNKISLLTVCVDGYIYFCKTLLCYCESKCISNELNLVEQDALECG